MKLLCCDSGVSELLGYTILVAIVAISVVALTSIGMGAISSSAKQFEFSGSTLSVKAFANHASTIAGTNNTYFTAYEMSVPPGYELIARDSHDDFRSMSVYTGDMLLTTLRTGSIRLQSPFKSITFEGGAVFSNDSGMIRVERKPGIYKVPQITGTNALYISIVAVACDTWVHPEAPVVLGMKCASSQSMKWHLNLSNATRVEVRTGDPAGWEKSLKDAGFSIIYEDSTLKATSWGISDIYVSYSTIYIKKGI